MPNIKRINSGGINNKIVNIFPLQYRTSFCYLGIKFNTTCQD